MSFLKKLQNKVALENDVVDKETQPEEKTETVLNNEKIEEVPVADTEVDIDNNNETPNSEISDVKKLEVAEKLIELRDVITETEGTGALEESNQVVKVYLDVLKQQYGVSLEAEEGDKLTLKQRIDKKIRDLVTSVKEWVGNLGDDLPDLTKINAVITRIEKMSNEEKSDFVKRINEKASFYLTNDGKLIQPAEMVKRVNNFDKDIVNSYNKAVKFASTEIKKLTSDEDQYRDFIRTVNKHLGYEDKSFTFPGIKISGDKSGNIVYLNTDKIKTKIGYNVTTADVLAYLKDIQKGWSDYQQLVKMNDATWRKLVKDVSDIFDESNTNNIQQDAIITMVYIGIHSADAIGDLFKVTKKAMKVTTNTFIN